MTARVYGVLRYTHYTHVLYGNIASWCYYFFLYRNTIMSQRSYNTYLGRIKYRINAFENAAGPLKIFTFERVITLCRAFRLLFLPTRLRYPSPTMLSFCTRFFEITRRYDTGYRRPRREYRRGDSRILTQYISINLKRCI